MACALPEALKASLTLPTVKCNAAMEPSASNADQLWMPPACESITRLGAAAAAPAEGPVPPRPSRRDTRTAERTMPSPITSTVTVAPLTMSALGGPLPSAAAFSGL